MSEAEKGGRLAQRAAMLCQEGRFYRYLDARLRWETGMSIEALPDGTASQQDAIEFLRARCGGGQPGRARSPPGGWRYVSAHRDGLSALGEATRAREAGLMNPWAMFALGAMTGAMAIIGAGAMMVWRATADLDDAGWMLGERDDD